MKLALALGWPSVEYMLCGLSYKELNNWIAYYSTEPFPEERADFRNGFLMSLIFNINRKKGATAATPQAFIPEWWEETKPKQKPAQIFAIAELINASFGGKIIHRTQ